MNFLGEFLSTFNSDNNVNSDNKNNNNDNKTDNNDMITKTLTPVHCRMKSGSAVVPFLLRFICDTARCKVVLRHHNLSLFVPPQFVTLHPTWPQSATN